MCGRYGCSLDTESLSCATGYKKKGCYKKVKCDIQEPFKPCCNIAPTMRAPILINNDIDYDPSLVLGRFGIVVPWVEYDAKNNQDSKYETHLCRLETIEKTKLHSSLLQSGKRCVIPCSAYFEWQSTKGNLKQPFCFYNKENGLQQLYETTGCFDENEGWKGLKLLFIAGLYNVHLVNKEKKYSFAIITRETNEDWMHVHHRMPAVLQNEDDVKSWLTNSKENALKIINKPIKNVEGHAVDKSKVNNTKNIGVECFKKFQNTGGNFLNNWLQKTPKNENSTSTEKKRSLNIEKENLPAEKKRRSDENK